MGVIKINGVTYGGGDTPDASEVSYSNTTSGLTATDVQAAVDEVVSDLSDKMDKANPTGTGSFSLNRKANTTVGTNSVAEGYDTTASGYASHAEGSSTKANAENSHAEGNTTEASGYGSHTEGYHTTASGDYSHAEGYYSQATYQRAHAEGYYTKAFQVSSHAEGSYTTASGESSHAEGNSTTASGADSHAEGASTTATNLYAHAEGNGTHATGISSHAEGGHTTASGLQSHAEGEYTTASGSLSHAEGDNTTATHYAQHVFGIHNILDGSSNPSTQKGNYVEIVGNGTDGKNPSNARTLDWSGNETLAGDIIINGNQSVTQALNGIPTELSDLSDISITNIQDGQIIEYDSTTQTWVNVANAVVDKMDKVNPTGTGSLSLNRKANTTIGTKSVAEGDQTTASGSYSHAEGGGTTASGQGSHAEGGGTTASGSSSHAEGGGTAASGNYSHAEGGGTTASGLNSHAEGYYTIAAGSNQHAGGKYNVADNNNTYAEIIGNGTANNARSNARTLDWQGNETIAGDLTFNGATSLSDTLDDKLSYTELTQAQYDVLVEDEEVDPDVAYMITDRNQSGGTYASGVIYDNTESGLSATNVQTAIDELAETGGGAGVSVLTYAEYQELVDAGEVNPDISYYISDSNTTGTNYAAGISYDNTESGMTATDVQEAVDELAPVKASISNIDNVTLTTSDNNKLLGSFVENNEVVVRAVGSESVSITFNSTQSNYSLPYNNTHVEKFGNVVSVCIVPKCVTAYSTYPGQLVYTGLPTPKQALYYTFNSPLGSGKIRLMIDTSGNLYLRYGNVNDEYDCTFTYVCW